MGKIKETLTNFPAEMIASGGLLLGGSSMAIYSEIVQRNLDLYWQLAGSSGVPYANVVLGQFGDIGVPISLVGLGSLFLGSALSDSENRPKSKKYFLAGGLLGGMIGSLSYIAMEVSLMGSKESLQGCPNPGGFCNGEFTDITAFSVPIIAAAALGLKLIHDKKHPKSNE